MKEWLANSKFVKYLGFVLIFLAVALLSLSIGVMYGMIAGIVCFVVVLGGLIWYFIHQARN